MEVDERQESRNAEVDIVRKGEMEGGWSLLTHDNVIQGSSTIWTSLFTPIERVSSEETMNSSELIQVMYSFDAPPKK